MILTIVQARCSSSRLPGKVLKCLLNIPMVWHQWLRMKRAKRIGCAILATSTDPSDEALADYFSRKNASVFRGSLHDVLDRYYQCALLYNPEHIVRITADCPLIDPEVIDQVITKHIQEKNDYTGVKGYPLGMSVEIFSFNTLKIAHCEAVKVVEREHVTVYMYQNHHRFKVGYLTFGKELSSENDGFFDKYLAFDADLSSLRLTVDYEEDFELISEIYAALYYKKPNFCLKDILIYLDEHPYLKDINSGMKQIQITEKIM